MLEQLIFNFGALGIVAYVVHYNMIKIGGVVKQASVITVKIT